MGSKEKEVDSSDGFLSDEVDERRSFTPQPRIIRDQHIHIPSKPGTALGMHPSNNDIQKGVLPLTARVANSEQRGKLEDLGS